MKRLSSLAAVLAPFVLVACGNVSPGDPHFDGGVPNTIGTGSRIRDISDPTKPTHADGTTVHNGVPGTPVSITAASTVIVDNFDETRNGKSRGTVYVQDFGSSDPYSGIALFSPTFTPSNLHLGPGDVIDMNGTYQENNTIPVKFPANEYLIQVSKPQVQFRYEYEPPTPVEIPVGDLATYATGRKWLSMVVTLKNVTIPAGSSGLVDDGKGRKTAYVSSVVSQTAPVMTNELFDLGAWNDQTHAIKPGVTIASLTGVVTYFFAMHIAPRSPADIVMAQ